MATAATVKAEEFTKARKVNQHITRYVVYFSHCDQFYHLD